MAKKKRTIFIRQLLLLVYEFMRYRNNLKKIKQFTIRCLLFFFFFFYGRCTLSRASGKRIKYSRPSPTITVVLRGKILSGNVYASTSKATRNTKQKKKMYCSITVTRKFYESRQYVM